jgi:hypothetical protein
VALLISVFSPLYKLGYGCPWAGKDQSTAFMPRNFNWGVHASPTEEMVFFVEEAGSI